MTSRILCNTVPSTSFAFFSHSSAAATSTAFPSLSLTDKSPSEPSRRKEGMVPSRTELMKMGWGEVEEKVLLRRTELDRARDTRKGIVSRFSMLEVRFEVDEVREGGREAKWGRTAGRRLLCFDSRQARGVRWTESTTRTDEEDDADEGSGVQDVEKKRSRPFPLSLPQIDDNEGKELNGIMH
jgi:hypothetical protein